MATYYWVGGSGTWNATSTTNWATSSGGAGSAGVPTSADNVIFDTLSNATAYTVTVGTNAVCADFTADGPLVGNVTFSLGATARIDCHSSMTLAATGITWTGTVGSQIFFLATTTGKTVTTNGVSLSPTNTFFSGNGGEWTLGSALSIGTATLSFTAGSLITANFNLTANAISASGTGVRSISLGSSTVTLSGSTAFSLNATNLTWDAGTSSIVFSGPSPSFNGGGLTFYNVSFTSAANGTTTINGANTFNDLNQISRSATGHRIVTLGDNQTVSGTLTLGAANTAIRRIHIQSSVIGTQRTITLNGTLAALADVDFRDIGAAGSVATPWTGTRLGNGLNNNNITFDAPKTVYWNLAGSASWTATGWATTNNGTPDVNNFPLAQDTATFTEAGSAETVTVDAAWYIGSIQMADGVSNRTTAFTLATAANFPSIYGNVTLFSNLTLTGNSLLTFAGQGTTQTITSAGVSFSHRILIDSPNGTVQLADNLTTTFITAASANFSLLLLSGTLDLNDNTANVKNFGFSATTPRAVNFGTSGKIVCSYSGNVYSTFGFGTGTGFTYTGTPYIEFTASDANIISIALPRTSNGGAETNALNYYFTGGSTGQVRFDTSSGVVVAKDVTFSNFAGTLANTNLNLYGNLILDSDMTLTAGTLTTTFVGTSGTQQITTAGKTLDFPITQNSPGGTVQLQDNLTMGSTRTFTLTNGTLDLSSGNRTLSTGIFSSSNSNTREIAFGTGNITLTGNAATIWVNQTSNNFSYTGTPTINCTYSGSTGTRIITTGTIGVGGVEGNSLNFNISAGTDIVSIGGGTSTGNTRVFKNVNFTGFSGTLTNSFIIIYGNLTISSGMTLSAGINTTTFAATSGTQQITSAGQTLDFPITVDGVGGAVQLQDNMTVAIGKTFTLTNGTLDIDGKVLSVGNFSSSNSNTRVIDFGTSGELIVAGVGTTAFNAGTSTGLSITGTNAEINMSGSTAKTFVGGSFVYPLTLNQGGLGDLTITGANTFNDMTNTVQPCTIIFPASTTTSFYNFNVNGTDGNLVLLRSSTTGTRYTLARLV
jgi:hypothetical protein